MAYQISDIGDLVLDHSWSTKKKMFDELSCWNSVNNKNNNNNNNNNNKFIYIALKLSTYSKVPIKLANTNTQQTVHFLRENENKTLQLLYNNWFIGH